MENPTAFYNRLSWLILFLVLIIFLLNIGGIIALFLKSKRMLDQGIFKRIKKFILLLGCSGFGIILIISSCWGTTRVPLLILSYQNEFVTCLQMPIGDEYKLIIGDRRNGEREVHLEEYDRSQRYIWAITKFAIFNEYVIGETSFLLYDQDYFWFNLNSKEFFATRAKTELSSTRKNEIFLDSLGEFGIFDLPEMIPVDTLCSNGECTPCNSPSFDP